MEQQAANVWRKRGFAAMKAAHEQFGKDATGADRLLGCLDTFRERVDHNVENTVPVGLVSFSDNVFKSGRSFLFLSGACNVGINAGKTNRVKKNIKTYRVPV